MAHGGEAAEKVPEGNGQSSEFADWQQTIMAHFQRIRRRLLFGVLSFVIFAIVGFVLSQSLLAGLSTRHPEVVQLVFLGPTEAFVARIKLALALGFVGAFPFLLGQVWSFCRPFLTRRQQIVSFALIPLSYGLFLTGAFVAYQGILPVALRFLLAFRSEDLEPMLSISPYISFVIFLVIPMALLFQLPIVVMFLARIGVLRPSTLVERRRYAILLFFVVGAILTPPDVFSQIMLALPLIVLFEISILFARLAAPRGRDTPGDDG